MNHKILVADDDEGVLVALHMLLRSEGFTAFTASSPEQALAIFKREEIHLALMDLNYTSDTTSGDEGLKLIGDLRQQDEFIPIVVMTGWGTIDVAVEAMRNGANDFIQKPWENDRLLTVIKNQTHLANAQKSAQKLSLQNKLLQEAAYPTQHMIAESASIKKVLHTLQQVAKSNVSILLTGENGTGKSMFARYIHALSPRKDNALVSVNMGAVTETLFESEMFGHTKGAFTDAKLTRIGRFELADEGTLFLDEIANTPYSQQGKLLRVLEDCEFEKVGSGKTQKVDFRLITATNADLYAAVNEGEFRKDLLYRINTVEIEIPALRNRREDIIPLANSFLQKAAKKYSQPTLTISRAAESTLMAYDWPGNVRELNHVMERAQILCQGSSVQPQDLGITPLEKPLTVESYDSNECKPLGELELEIIHKRLAHFNGDANAAAKSLGLSRSAFYRRLEKSNND